MAPRHTVYLILRVSVFGPVKYPKDNLINQASKAIKVSDGWYQRILTSG